jgi:hypothetical protein
MVSKEGNGGSTMKVARLHDQPDGPRPLDLSMQELYKVLLKSEKFLNWKPYEDDVKVGDKIKPIDPALSVDEKHLTPQELAEAWGVSTETIRFIFRDEPGVLKIGKPGTRSKRGYFTLRIPREVAERVHRRLAA